MTSQIDRSKARRALTRSSGDAVLAMISRFGSRDETDLRDLYDRICRAVIRRLTEAYTSVQITDDMVRKNDDLEFLIPTVGQTKPMKDVPELDDLERYLARNISALTPEDLGGISELFSGHRVNWNNSEPKFDYDSTRRGAGRVYTPFDVTRYMCEQVIPALVRRCETYRSFRKLRIIDPACGSGAFLTQASRVLIREANSRWPGKEVEISRAVFSEILHGVDIDGFAVSLCRLVLWMEAGAPTDPVGFCLCEFDSLSLGGSPSISEWEEATELGVKEDYDLWIGNPPYVRIRPVDFEGFEHRNVRNLYALFCELGISLTRDSGIFSMIVPQSVVGSRDAESLRSYIIDIQGSVRFQVFDSVPDFLFDQGKIESNTNTNINQRTTIVSVEKGGPEILQTSPLLRWRRSERNHLFDNLRCLKITRDDMYGEKIPMVGSEEELTLLRELLQVEPTIAGAIGGGSNNLFMTKAVRYFITALPESLGRPNSINLHMSEEDFPSIHVLLNSNVFYWWWRVFGNGFQVEIGDIESFPMLPLDPKRATELSERLIAAEASCRVVKRNAGKDIPNINFNYSMELLSEIDREILSSVADIVPDFILRSKSNSLHGRMDELVGYSEA